LHLRLPFASEAGSSAAFTNAYEAAEVGMQLAKIGADPETGCQQVNAVEIYKQMLLPHGAEQGMATTFFRHILLSISLLICVCF
jgi:hypothetical protein